MPGGCWRRDTASTSPPRPGPSFLNELSENTSGRLLLSATESTMRMNRARACPSFNILSQCARVTRKHPKCQICRCPRGVCSPVAAKTRSQIDRRHRGWRNSAWHKAHTLQLRGIHCSRLKLKIQEKKRERERERKKVKEEKKKKTFPRTSRKKRIHY
ncbi:hypothetical protein PUN28_002628 [Cardiocondyla obscurior]|uniref:Uncharacterized protein n=1 Tax=Cardiocondyla obscurior TaxID=286306 RepID=A0AAW2GVJ2_9HYME